MPYLAAEVNYIDPGSIQWKLRGQNDADGTDFAFGVGLGFAPTPSWLLRLEGQSLTIDGELLYTKKDTGFDSVLFELQHRF